MFAHELVASELVKLVKPVVERDAPVSVGWINNPAGHETMRLMGVTEKDNKPTTLEQEKNRIRDFLDKKNELNWEIEFDGQIIGAIWVDLEPTEHLRAPSVHIMIGDPTARGQGVGSATVKAVLDYLTRQNYKKIYSRHLTDNLASAKLLNKSGFKNVGEIYKDKDGLSWQNVVKELTNSE